MTSAAVSSRTARRGMSRTRTQFVIAADEQALGALDALLASLPLCSSGRVFIEVPDASWIVPLTAPSRMTVTWLARSRGAALRSPGHALSRAVTAWADEMLCDGAEGTRVELLAGYLATADIVDHLIGIHGVSAASIRTPAVYGLPTAC
ncbi:hypothetical protein GCM10009808_03350 [Microbacterium sediminicola]|uniref:SIP-like Rossmann fold domain-containing protein n=1 Tax=Microbacterium sediminicola TaxID=415210 RepID=A0ABN2HL12_9MICO